jgi:hypothetical protein
MLYGLVKPPPALDFVLYIILSEPVPSSLSFICLARRKLADVLSAHLMLFQCWGTELLKVAMSVTVAARIMGGLPWWSG